MHEILIIILLILWPPPEDTRAEQWYNLRHGLLDDVISYEASGDVVRKRLRKDGTWFLVCGEFQINCGTSWTCCEFARGPGRFFMAAQLLDRSRRKCIKNGGCACPEAHWNWGDSGDLCRALVR